MTNPNMGEEVYLGMNFESWMIQKESLSDWTQLGGKERASVAQATAQLSELDFEYVR